MSSCAKSSGRQWQFINCQVQGSWGRDMRVSVSRSLSSDVTKLQEDYVTRCVWGEFLSLRVRVSDESQRYFKGSYVDLWYIKGSHHWFYTWHSVCTSWGVFHEGFLSWAWHFQFLEERRPVWTYKIKAWEGFKLLHVWVVECLVSTTFSVTPT